MIAKSQQTHFVAATCAGALLIVSGCSAPDAPSTELQAAPETSSMGETTSPTLSRSVEVTASAAEVWAEIGAFCSVPDWHPAIATCTLDGDTPPTRTLVTVDGQATFIELESARDDAMFTYSYAILSGPLPLTDYVATISVTEIAGGGSTVTWSSHYTPLEGRDDDAAGALTGIYDSGLSAIADRF